MKYIDAEKLKEQIQFLIDSGYDKLQGSLYHVLSIIDSLQQEQPEAEFEKAYKSYMQSRKDDLSGNAVTVNMKDLARHFFGLGKLNARKEKQ